MEDDKYWAVGNQFAGGKRAQGTRVNKEKNVRRPKMEPSEFKFCRCRSGTQRLIIMVLTSGDARTRP